MIFFKALVMKKVCIVFSLLYCLVSYTQEIDAITGNSVSTSSTKEFVPNVYTRDWPRKLKNQRIWKHVAENRFECPFLKLAVEWDGVKYQLIETEEEGRILFANSDYSLISNKIVELTLNSSPNTL